jgi:hypothetical protein
MANHYISINRGVPGSQIADFTFGSASTAGDDIEVRVADVDGQGNPLTRKDIRRA